LESHLALLDTKVLARRRRHRLIIIIGVNILVVEFVTFDVMGTFMTVLLLMLLLLPANTAVGWRRHRSLTIAILDFLVKVAHFQITIMLRMMRMVVMLLLLLLLLVLGKGDLVSLLHGGEA
jgi:hypothetical protein